MTHKRVTSQNHQNGNTHLDAYVHAQYNNVGLKTAEMDHHLFGRRALITIGGLYGLTVSVMGIVIPFTYFVSLWAQQKIVYFYLFYAYVFLFSLAFMVYASVMAYRLRNGCQPNGIPCVQTTHEGINLYLIFAIIVFGSLSVLFHILIFVSYKQDHLQYECYGSGQIATSVLVIIFVLCQMIFLLIHSKTVFNFKPMLMKIGLIHLIAANMCNWGLAVLFEAAEVYLHSNFNHDDVIVTTERQSRAVNDVTLASSTKNANSEDFVSKCLQLNTIVMKASPYLMPFFVEFSLTAVSVVYRILKNVAGKPEKQQLLLIDKKNEYLLTSQNCSFLNPVTYVGWLLKLGTVCITIIFILIQERVIHVSDEAYFRIPYSIYMGTQYVLLAIAMFVTLAAAYHTNKCHYVRQNPESSFDEMLLLLSLGGFYFLLAFVIIASCYLSTEPTMSPAAELYIFWAVVNYVQATIQVIYIRDGLRRRALTKACLANKTAKTFIILSAVSNECLWIVMSFMLKEITSSRLMTSFYSSLTWVIISSTFLPLAIFFRFHSGACISEIIEVLYHGTCYVGNRHISAKRWTMKDND